MPYIILKIMFNKSFNENILLNIDFTEENSVRSANFTRRQLAIIQL